MAACDNEQKQYFPCARAIKSTNSIVLPTHVVNRHGCTELDVDDRLVLLSVVETSDFGIRGIVSAPDAILATFKCAYDCNRPHISLLLLMARSKPIAVNCEPSSLGMH